jgi:hypothetical protein
VQHLKLRRVQDRTAPGLGLRRKAIGPSYDLLRGLGGQGGIDQDRDASGPK